MILKKFRECNNGNEWAKRQAAKAGLGFEPLDNGFAAVDDVAALQAICDSLGPAHIEALLRKWLAVLPSPFTAEDEDAGYAYELSVLQAEFSLTQMLDRPVAGRIFFEQVLRDNLDIGRPDQIGLVFGRRLVTKGRRRTPGKFRTRVITDGVTPSLHVDYKNSKIKQYHKLGKAIRTETTINDAKDFGLSKRLTNLPALRQIGFTANRRLLGVQTISHDPVRGAQAFTDLTAPIITPAGTRIPGLRFGDPRAHALLQALLIHRLLPRGFTNRELRTLIAPLLGTTAEDITAGKMTTTCAASANTASSPASRTPADTRSPTAACTTRCCSPTPTTTCSARAWPSSPTPARPHPPGCAPPPAPTRPPTTTSPARPTSPPEHHHRAQPGRDPPAPQLIRS